MDAAARAELAALRRRAYGRDPDIAGDPTALKRLVELEELALPALPAVAPARSWMSGVPRFEALTSDSSSQAQPTSDRVTHAGAASDLVTDADLEADSSARGGSSPRRVLIIGLVALVAVLAASLGAVRGLQTVTDPIRVGAAASSSTATPAATDLTANGPVIISLLIDDERGEFIDTSSRPDAPTFLANGLTTWAQSLGVYYGWALWVAEVSTSEGLQNCLLLTIGTASEAQCMPHDATAGGALGVSLAYDKLTETQRPLGMAPDQRVSFG